MTKDNMHALLDCWARSRLNAWSMGSSSISIMMELGVVIDLEHGCRVLDKDEVADNIEKIVRGFEKFDEKAATVLRVHYGALPGLNPLLPIEKKAKRLKMGKTQYCGKLDKAIDLVRSGLELMYRSGSRIPDSA